MARIQESPALTPGNRIYLYRLLSQELGCGKQTFLPAVEEALASDRMTADELGFDSTRALLEALDEFIKLTVFKGGRIYATVISQPAWDDALATLASGKQSQADSTSKANKPWKRKKADKSLKPVRPKRVKRIEPEPVAVSEPIAKPEPAVEPAVEAQPEPESAIKAELEPAVEPKPEPVVETTPADENATANESASADVDTPETVTEPSPAIALTVTYDPYSGIDRETKLVSHPVTAPAPERRVQRESAPAPTPVASTPSVKAAQPATSPAPKPVKPAASPAQAQAVAAPAQPSSVQLEVVAEDTPASPSQREPARPEPAQPEPARSELTRPEPLAAEVLASYPADFSTDVYLASDRVAELCELLPYGTDVFALLAEDYARARALELIAGTRARATFPLRIQRADSIEPIRIGLKKRSGTGLQWELATVE